jgi:thioredoxin family protein
MREANRLKILVAVIIGILGVAAALALGSVTVPAWVLIAILVAIVDTYWIVSIWFRERVEAPPGDTGSDKEETFSAPGFSVEVDCRACGKFNRVPGHRLRDRPKCGRCKVHLMPGKRVVVCRVTSSLMKGPLRVELDAVWTDESRLWQGLADHVAFETKGAADAKNPSRRTVN